MASKFSPSSFNQLETELFAAGKNLLRRRSLTSTADILNLLTQMKQLVSKVEQNPSESMKSALHPITEALTVLELVRHDDMDVNISVACCFCEILRINAPNPPYNNEQLKDVFEMIVITFEKLSSASGGCYMKMAEVLKLFSSYKLWALMLDLEGAYGLIVCLFKQFLTVADSNSSAIVLKMEKIMSMIIEESDKELKLELVGLLVTFLKNNNPIASPVCWQLGEKVLMNFGARFKPHFPDMGRDMSIALYDYSRLVASICKTASENDIMEGKETTPYTTEVHKLTNVKTHKIKIECAETVRRCQHGEKSDLFDDLPKPLTDWKGKRKRNNRPSKIQMIPSIPTNISPSPKKNPTNVSSSEDFTVCVKGYKVKRSVAKTLRAIFKKHGDIAANCIFKTPSERSSILETVCEVVKQIQTNDDVIENVEEIKCQVSVAEAANVDVTWLWRHLEAVYKKMDVLENSNMLMEAKRKTVLAKRAARMDLKEGNAELMAAGERVQKAEMLVNVLELVEKKLDDSILESKAKLDTWVQPPFL